MHEMLEKFFDGRVAVWINKNNQEEIKDFYAQISNTIEGWPRGLGKTALDYLLNPISGPCHFMNNFKHIDGGSLKHSRYVKREVINVSDFLYGLSSCNEISEDEYADVLADTLLGES